MRKALLLILVLAGCGPDLTGVSEAAPGIYRDWYAQVEQCSGLSGNFDRIRWRHVATMTERGVNYAGRWYSPHTITIVDAFEDSERVVKHEIMHDLLQSGEHPAHYFSGVCGELMP